VAFWQVAYPGSYRSQVLTLDYYNGQCASAFGVPPMQPAAVAAFNAKYNGWGSTATNVFATNGGDDPWRGATMNASISATYLENNAACDGCGHCGDLHAASASDPEPLTKQRQLLTTALATWLKAAAAERA
jgi:hypothetical protein